MTGKPEAILEQKKKRIQDAIALKTPDKVPLFFPISAFGAKYGGITVQEAFDLKNSDKWYDINEKLLLEYNPDFYLGPIGFDLETNAILGNQQYKWPGNGIDPNHSFQFVEGEYVKADEYDEFLENPGDFLFRKYLPRIYSNLSGLSNMPPLMTLTGGFSGGLMTFSNPAVIEALETIVKVAKMSTRGFGAQFGFVSRMKAHGFPFTMGGGNMAPFDVISDFFRGLKGSTLDMYRCPDKLKAAHDKVLNFLISSERDMGPAGMADVPLAFMALHRGSDGFMSLKQFEEFYWPGLKKVIYSVIDSGKIPFLFLEGCWDQRLEYLRELPKGKTLGWFDCTDLFKAKDVIGDTMCICGGMPASMLQASSPEQIDDHVKKLIQEVGKDGGFIMGASTVMDDAKPEQVKAWAEATRKYGDY